MIPVHFGGHPCEMAPLLDMAHDRGLKVIEDAAHALPAAYRGRAVGTIGDIGCFSFYATKTITTGEGGMLTTAKAAELRRSCAHHEPAWNQQDGVEPLREGRTWFYEILRPGYKYNLTDLAAAMGIEQLKKHRCSETSGLTSRRGTTMDSPTCPRLNARCGGPASTMRGIST